MLEELIFPKEKLFGSNLGRFLIYLTVHANDITINLTLPIVFQTFLNLLWNVPQSDQVGVQTNSLQNDTTWILLQNRLKPKNKWVCHRPHNQDSWGTVIKMCMTNTALKYSIRSIITLPRAFAKKINVQEFPLYYWLASRGIFKSSRL